MHISPCVVNVMAAAAADFPGFPKPYTAANLETKPSAEDTKHAEVWYYKAMYPDIILH